MMNLRGRLVVGFGLVAGGCIGDGLGEVTVTAEAGMPLPGLTAEELARFEAGKGFFTKTYTPEEGLGPLYTENSCNACHHEPETGGGGGDPDIHATRFVDPDSCDTMRYEGGFVRRGATPLMEPFAPDRRQPPTHATEVERFFPPPLYGRGLIEAIPDETIIAMADPDDENDDGLSGRVSWLADGRLGRFRRKADRAMIVDLSDAGVRFAIGLTTPDNPAELPYRGKPIPPETDPAPDPEIDREAIEAIADYIRFLALPERAETVDEDDERMIHEGEHIFDEIGCAACHVQRLLTGPNEVAALDRKVVPLYSDLLLHDMGPDLAGVCGPTATPSELRTEILWGLGHRGERLMHDGSAQTMREAIELHGGEARASRAAFNRLSVRAQEMLIKFLWSL